DATPGQDGSVRLKPDLAKSGVGRTRPCAHEIVRGRPLRSGQVGAIFCCRIPSRFDRPVTRGGLLMEDKPTTAEPTNHVSRRNFIKGVIASGAVVSSAGYLWRSGALLGQQPSAPGSVERLITLNVNGQDRRVDVLKQETLATTLRYKLGLTGTK